jgi:hypothetical protein
MVRFYTLTSSAFIIITLGAIASACALGHKNTKHTRARELSLQATNLKKPDSELLDMLNKAEKLL